MEFKAVVLYLLVLISLFSNRAVGIDAQQVTIATPGPISESGHVRCARVPISGLSRLKLGSYSSAHIITVTPSDEIKKRLHKKIQICSHTNPSLGLCQCNGSGDWENIYNGMWSSLVSPNQDRFVDIMFVDKLSGTVKVAVELELHKWRLLIGLIGIGLWFLAPIASSWVPFYYGSSMALGVCLLVIFLLYQGKKLLPPVTGWKKFLYSAICAAAVPAGMFVRNLVSSIFVDLGIGEAILIPVGGAQAFLWNRFLVFVRSVIAELGISEEIVLLLLGVGIALVGAGFGLSLLHQFAVMAEDGTVCVGVGQFVKWALRVIAVTCIYLSQLDAALAMLLLACLMAIHLAPMAWHGFINGRCYSGLVVALRASAELLKRKAMEFRRRRRLWSKGRLQAKLEFYSTFHKIPWRKKLSRREWKMLTEESTRQAVAELASTPEFADWIIRNADRIQTNNPEESGLDQE